MRKSGFRGVVEEELVLDAMDDRGKRVAAEGFIVWVGRDWILFCGLGICCFSFKLRANSCGETVCASASVGNAEDDGNVSASSTTKLFAEVNVACSVEFCPNGLF